MSATPIEMRAAARAGQMRAARRHELRHAIQLSLVYLALAIASIVAIFPFLYILSLSFKQSTSLVTYPPQWIPNPLYYGNYTSLILEKPFLRWGLNTLLVAGTITVIKLLFDSMSGYAF